MRESDYGISQRGICKHHGLYHGASCSKCFSESSPRNQSNMTTLTHISREYNRYFATPGIGNLSLDTVVQECLSHPMVIEFLKQCEPESVEYYMLRYHVVELIKIKIKAYIDESIAPKSAD